MRRSLLKKQPTWGLRRAQGTGQKSATPATLTKVILVLLTMFLLPSAAWGQITVAGNSPGQSGNITGTDITGTVTYSNGTLTLTDAEITGDIVWNPSENTDLTINLSGNNTLNGTISTDENTNLSFTGSGSLAIAKESGYAITEFNTVSLATGLYLKSDWPGAYWDEDRNTFVGYNSALSSLTITSEVYYPIWVVSDGVNYTQVSGANKGNVFNDNDTPKVSYDSDNNQLTLNNWECATTGGEFAIILGDQKSFNIQLGGVNKIGGSVIFFAKGDASLALSTDDELKGSLTIVQNQSNNYYFTNIPDVNITYSKLTRTDNAVTYQAPPITVAGVSPDSEGKFSGISGVTFTPAKIGADQSSIPATLTLNEATINGKIEWKNGTNNLRLCLSGKNSIICNKGGEPPVSVFKAENTCTLFVEKVSDAESATLKYASYGTTDGTPSNVTSYFENFILSANTAFNQTAFVIQDGDIKYNYLTTTGTDNLSVAGIQVHGISGELGYRNNILQDEDATVKFDGSQTLTLNNAEIYSFSSTHAIETGLNSLSINLIGTNTITTADGYAISGIGDVAKNVSITSSSTPHGGTLTLSRSSSSSSGLISNISLNTEGWTVTYPSSGTSLADANQAIISKGTITGLKIAGTLITSEYLENGVISSDVSGITDGTVSFTETPATLTLDGAKITGTISWTKSAPLTIAIKGTNSVTTTGGPAIEGNYQDNTTLTFSKVSETGKCKLILSGSSDASISGFNNNSNTYAGSGLVYYADSSEDGITATISSTLSGVGTSTDPYLIETSEDFKDFAIFVDRGFITNEYIKLSDNVNDYIDCSNLEDFETIGNSLYKFTGTFDGNEKTIKNLSVKGKGLFYTDSYAPIKVIKLTLDHLTVTGLNTYSGQIGAIASELWSGEDSEPWKDEIEGCVVKNSLITCENNFGNPWIGGIVGANNGGTITNCIVEDTEITASTENTGESGANSKAGGIVCYNSGSISGCQVKGNTIVTAAHTISSDVSAGAIVCMNGATGFTNNTYEYTVKTQTKGSGDNGYNTKDKYIHRGTGSANYDANSDEGVKDPEGIAMYTKKVIIPLANNQQSGGNVGNVMVDLYYMKSGEDNTIYNVAPGEEIVLFVEYYALKGSYTLNGETEPITLKNTESNDWYSFDMPDADVTFTLQEAAIVHFSEEGEQSFATYYNATKDMAVPMGMTAYMVTGISEDGTKIIVSPVSYIKAGVAVLIEKDKTTEVSETTDFSGSKLVHAENDVPATENTKLYVLYNNKYVKVTAGTKILSGSCYLNLSGVANTRGFYEIGGGEGTTAISKVISEGVNSEKLADGEWYTLQGQRVANPAKGLYIRNGKKVVVK